MQIFMDLNQDNENLSKVPAGQHVTHGTPIHCNSFNILKVLKNLPEQGLELPENRCLSCQNSCFQHHFPLAVKQVEKGRQRDQSLVPALGNKCLRGDKIPGFCFDFS